MIYELVVVVAPFTGAWIEIAFALQRFYEKDAVAPFTGAWIEIKMFLVISKGSWWSHPSRVRGLKLGKVRRIEALCLSHPSRVRGLKFCLLVGLLILLRSHPSRVRGLKYDR